MTKKIKTLIVSITCGVVIVGIALTLFFIVNICQKLEKPKNLRVIDNLPNNQIIIQVDEVNSAEKYVFKITKNNNSNLFLSTTNTLDVTSQISEVGTYQISCQAVGKTKSSISDYSSVVQYTVTRKLNMPVIELHNTEQKLLFTSVANADSYKLIYGVDEQGEFKTLEESRNADLGRRYFDLSSLEKGSYSLSVVALASGYESSDMSSQVLFIKNDVLETPTNLSFNTSNKMFSFESSCKDFKIVISYENSELTKTFYIQEITQNKVFDLSSYAENDISKIEVTALGKVQEYTINSQTASLIVWRIKKL